MEVIVKAKTVEEALETGAKKLGKTVDEVEYTVIKEAKKGLLGMFSAEAEVKVFTKCDEACEEKAEEASCSDEVAEEAEITAENENTNYEDIPPVQEKVLEFLNTIITDMGVDAVAKVSCIDERLAENGVTYEKDIHIEIAGKGLGMLIGRHGDVLDSLQYLSNILAGRYPKRADKHEYVRIIIDIENYRSKREDTLKSLARRVSSKVLATGRNYTLEPMSSYERRVIHFEIQQIKGVHTYSVGSDGNRRVVVAYGDDVENA